MPEFKFACPECKQQVVCDVGYAGSRINCPICQKTIPVPSQTEPVLQIKLSTLKNAGFISGGALLAILLLVTGLHFFGGSKMITFHAYVDGSDLVKLSGKRLWVEHLTWQQPTRMMINGKAWDPPWIANEATAAAQPATTSALPPAQSSTAPYQLSRTFKPGNPANLKLTKRIGRGAVSIVQMPSRANDGTLAILLDDGPQGGADHYEFTLSW